MNEWHWNEIIEHVFPNVFKAGKMKEQQHPFDTIETLSLPIMQRSYMRMMEET